MAQQEICKDIQAKCPQCGKYVLWLMDRPPSRRVVEIKPLSVKPQGLDYRIRWKKHPCDVGTAYDPKKTYSFDMWGYGHEVENHG